MRYISYALFKDCKDFEWNYYLRGLYFNVRMNKLIYPNWRTHVAIHKDVYDKYTNYIQDLQKLITFDVTIIDEPVERCKAMLWRLDVLFTKPHVEAVICRDLDAITTYRESLAVNSWLQSGRIAHGINDNPAHSIALMGGMCGFTRGLLNRVTVSEWIDIKAARNLKAHGSDQDLLMTVIYPRVEDSIVVTKNPLQVRDNHLWESDLVCSFIGSAGVNEMELIRFFANHDENSDLFTIFEKEYKELMYWRNV
jgi:hypothetical protein